MTKPTSLWETFDYALLIAIVFTIAGLIGRVRRGKVKDKIRAATHKPKFEYQTTSTDDLEVNPQVIAETTAKLEGIRKRHLWTFIILSGALGYFVVVHLIFNFDKSMERLHLLLFWLMPSIFLSAFIQWRYKKHYQKHFVASILEKVDGVSSGLSGTSAKRIVLDLLPGLPSGYIKSSNHLSLETDLWQANAATIRIEQKSGDHTRTVFNGTVVHLNITNSASTEQITISEKSTELDVGKVLQNLFKKQNNSGSERQKINLLSPEFNKLFDVFGGDQVGARKILKPAVIEKIISLAAHNNLTQLTFDHRLIVAAFSSADSNLDLSPRWFLLKPMDTEQRLANITASINQIQSDVEKLYDLI